MAPDDEYFPPEIYAALAIAYGHPRVGTSTMPLVDERIALTGRDAVPDYPLSENVDGVTAGAQQFEVPPDEGAGGSGHGIYVWRDDTRYQLTCFLKTWVETGTAVIVEPQDEAETFDCD
jgi:hypothetical protein